MIQICKTNFRNRENKNVKVMSGSKERLKGESHEVLAVIIHEDFNNVTYENNIGLIKVKRNFLTVYSY